jgi:predicted porin
MKHQRIAFSVALILAAAQASKVYAIDLQAGDWKFTIEGNVNAHYVYSSCEDHPADVAGGLACVNPNGSSSGVANGLLPAAITFNGSTTQDGYDIGFTFGLYPGIDTNDGGSPNLQSNPPTNTALGTAGLDVRQVFLTFGNDSMGTIMAGRNIGLFGADAILNDMTLLGVGAGNGDYAAPANTSLGSIGLGYIYTDWIPQIDYTTPKIGGAKLTVGIFQPLNSLGQPLPSAKKEPGFHAKLAWTITEGLYLSATYLWQKQNDTVSPGVGNYSGHAFDVGGKWDIGMTGLEVAGWYYNGKGVGTTGLFVLSNDALGNPRDSDGFLAQVTWKISKVKLGVNYGESNLKLASGEVNPTLVAKNDKVTGGIYYDLTKNLMLVTEYSYVEAKNQAGASNKANNFNVGAFLKF